MLTLAETLADQEDLAQLCSDRPLVTNEIFAGNAFYGSDFVLKQYAGLPPDACLKVVVPHGPYLGEGFVWEAELHSPLPAMFYYSDQVRDSYANAMQQAGLGKRLIPAAASFLYVVDLLKNQPKPDRQGTIFFPSHSTHHVTAQLDFETLADHLLQLDAQFQPVTVCLYWKDFTLDRHLPFQKRGLRIVSAGHMFDPLFLFRLYHLCSVHHYAAGNELGSHIFYSIKAGCSYFYLDQLEGNYQISDPTILKRDVGELSLDTKQTLKSLFKTPYAYPTAAQLAAVDAQLGTKYFQQPQDLRQQFDNAEQLYTFEHHPKQFIETAEINPQLSHLFSGTNAAANRFLYHFFAKIWPGSGQVCAVGSVETSSPLIARGMAVNSRYRENALYVYTRSPETQSRSEDFLADPWDSDQPANPADSPTLYIREAVLPATKAAAAQLDSPLQIPADLEFDAIVINGCESWYAIKHLMQKLGQHCSPGTYFLVQNYGAYSYFWLPFFLQLFKANFRLVSSIDSTYAFQLVSPLAANLVDQRYPDEPTPFDKRLFDRLFTELFAAAQQRYDVHGMVTYTIQHGAALAYIGDLNEAKAKILSLITQTWARELQPVVKAALHQPTHRSDGTPIQLYSVDEVEQWVQWAEPINPYPYEIAYLQNQLQQYQAKLARSESDVQQLQSQLQALHDRVVQRQMQLEESRATVESMGSRIQQLEETLRETTGRIRAIESSKLWKVKRVWSRFKRKIGLEKR